MADERWRRPGSEPAEPRPGLLDPQAHALPPAPEPTAAPAAEPDGAAGDDELELGSSDRSSPRVRVGAGIAVAALVCAGLVVGGLQLRDRRETVDAGGLVAAADGFRSDTRRGGLDRLTPEDLVTYKPGAVTPANCLNLVQPGGDGVADAVLWGQQRRFGDDIEVLALRYGTPGAARTAVREVDRSLADCATVTFGDGRDATPFEVARRTAPLDGAIAYELTGADGSYGSYLRRVGNVVVWTVGRGADGDPAERAAADDLVAELHRRVAG